MPIQFTQAVRTDLPPPSIPKRKNNVIDKNLMSTLSVSPHVSPSLPSPPHVASGSTSKQAGVAPLPPKTSGTLRAFSVAVTSWIPEHVGIYAATSAAKAKFACWKGAQDAGFEKITFAVLRVRRAPEFDGIAGKLKHGVDREYACLLKEAAKEGV